MEHHELEKEAREGKIQLIGKSYSTFLPNNVECDSSMGAVSNLDRNNSIRDLTTLSPLSKIGTETSH